MSEKRQQKESSHLDQREFDLPETTYSRDIENRVFQDIVLKTLSDIEGIGLIEGNFLNTLIGKPDTVKGIVAEQDPKTHSVRLKIEVRIKYGLSIPHVADEIQTLVVQEITKMTGVRVSEIHVIFKELLPEETQQTAPLPTLAQQIAGAENVEIEDEF
jgi:uncharacterized alkaline shock family protein YloU